MARLIAVSVLLVLCAYSGANASSVAVENAARYFLTQHNLSHESPLKLQSVVRVDEVAVAGGARYDLSMAVTDRYHQMETVEGSVFVTAGADAKYSLVEETGVVSQEEEMDDQTFAQKAAEYYVATINQATSMLLGGSDDAAVKFSVESIDGARVEGKEVRMILTLVDSSNESRRIGLVVRRNADSMEVVEGEELEEDRTQDSVEPMPAVDSNVETVVQHYLEKVNQAMKAIDASSPTLSLNRVVSARNEGARHFVTLELKGADSTIRQVDIVADLVEGHMHFVQANDKTQVAVATPTKNHALSVSDADVKEAAELYVSTVNKAISVIHSDEEAVSLVSIDDVDGASGDDGFRYHLTLTVKQTTSSETQVMEVTILKSADGQVVIEDSEEILSNASAATPTLSGPATVDLNDMHLKEVLGFYTQELSTQLSAPVSVVSVMDAEREIVGEESKYVLSLILAVGKDMETRRVNVVAGSNGMNIVEDKLSSSHDLLEVIGAPAEEKTQVTAMLGGRTSSGPATVDLNDMHLKEVLGFYTQELSTQLSAPVSVVSVMDAEREIVGEESKYVLSLILAVGKDMETRRVNVVAGSNGMNIVEDKLSSSHDLLEVIGAPAEEKTQVTAMLAAARPSTEGQNSAPSVGFNAMTIAGVVAGFVGVVLVVAVVIAQLNKRSTSREPVFNPDLEESLL